MGYGSYYRKRYTKKYRTYRKKTPTVRRLAKKVKTLSKDAIQWGATNFSMVAQFPAISTTWTELVMLNPAESVAQSGRIGRQYCIKGIETDGVMTQGCTNTALDDSRNLVRIVVALWQQGAGTTPLQSGGVGISDPINKYTENIKGNLLKKYIDMYIPFSTPGRDSTGYIAMQKVIKFYKRLSATINYGDDTTSFPNKRLIMSMVSDSGAPPNPGFTAGYTRVIYTQ